MTNTQKETPPGKGGAPKEKRLLEERSSSTGIIPADQGNTSGDNKISHREALRRLLASGYDVAFGERYISDNKKSLKEAVERAEEVNSTESENKSESKEDQESIIKDMM